MNILRVIAASCRMQVAETRRVPAQMLILATSPLFAAMFLSVMKRNGDPTVLTNAVFAPALISLWFMSLDLGGGMISNERWQATLEGLIGSPSRLGAVVFGRIIAVVGLAALTFVESYVMARLVFRMDVRIVHPLVFVLTLVVTLFAMAGTATALAGLFVLSRNVLLFQNSMTYPFYILGGVLVPVSLLPFWAQPVTRVFFLSWSSDLVRASMRTDAPGWAWQLAVVAVLGAAGLVGGLVLIERVVRRVTATGSAAMA
ncbi:ABC transporter permease [Streptantibioticus ferralitis]|uniref:ABC transporter permease n=1 Tax=Streptantibioticus ferralitis TaxID=236510 RepID=A0ABT5Z1N5_9ACTN|nr:ABC transporter permease [Streptantibioticus ferralitis]MDF2257735.1 ABC transporter permease [Streptantibioticus ferralitis]